MISNLHSRNSTHIDLRIVSGLFFAIYASQPPSDRFVNERSCSPRQFTTNNSELFDGDYKEWSERKKLQWLATFSTDHAAKLQSLHYRESTASADLALLEFVASLIDEDWDASKHPRRGSPPNAG